MAQAQEAKDQARITQIQQIILREHQRQRFATLHCATGRPRGRSVSSVQLEQDGVTIKVKDEETVTNAIITEVHNKRFTLAFGAPICNVPLAQDFGLLSMGPSAQAVLSGTYNHPALDHATADMLSEVATIRSKISSNPISTNIMPLDWKQYWTRANERTSLSPSGLHFGHYKASIHPTYLTHFHAAKATVALTVGTPYNRWKKGVMVMLEKELGVNLVSKLRAILLMEADFNATNKMFFSSRMLQNIRLHRIMPEEIFSEQGQTSVEGTLSKILFYDKSRQFRQTAAIASVDASSCFD